MRTGPRFVRSDITPSHPLEAAQTQHHEHQEKLKLGILGAIQGQHAPQLIRLERSLLAQHQVLPVTASTPLGLEVSLNMLDTMMVEDYLNDPADAEVMGNVHTMAEASPLFGGR
eukprot:m.5173 g.5173  ORF g.5173 m.5173 type:complete len:114 (-) comp4850_c0_seq1:734-1075(-)